MIGALSSLRAEPILWLTATLMVFAAADAVSRRTGRHPLAHPVLWSTPVLMGLLTLSGTPYPVYASATAMLGFLLGPAVVGLAVPIWKRRRVIRRLALPLTAALLAGSATAILSGVGVVWLMGAPDAVIASVAPRAATTPVGMQVSAMLGGLPALTAAIVIFSGVLGAMIATPLLNIMGVTDYRARGFAVGVSAHGLGAARAFQVNATAGAFAGLGMALNAGMTALLLSLAAGLK